MLLDTSGLYCYLDSADKRHSQAVVFLDSTTLRLTHNYVLAELVALCSVRRIDRNITLGFVEALAQDPAIELRWVDRDLHRRAIDLLRERPDKTYSLCDAVSFLLMREHRVTEALTTDRHFEQEGFTKLLAE